MKHFDKFKKGLAFLLCLGLTVSWGQTTTLDYTGTIQTYVVPADVNVIQITTIGAAGGQGVQSSSGIPGKGASIQGTFEVTPGDILNVLVGEQGDVGSSAYVGGGGGGSFVWIESSDELLSAAGGGGGGGATDGSPTFVDGIDASVSIDGTNGAGFSEGAGTAGNGGVAPSVEDFAAGGAGWLSNGADGADEGCTHESTGGQNPLAGGAGGSGGGTDGSSSDGGYGGGGGGNARCGAVGGGGGGGYSGGGAGGELIAGDFNAGGGGGSFNAGSSQVNNSGVGTGNGQVIISVVCHVIELTASLTDEIGGTDGAINLSVSGGTSPYTYDWNNDGTGDFDDDEDLVALTAGEYIVVVKDNTGCTETASFTVDSQVGINELNGVSLSVYPNPTAANFTIELEGEFAYSVTTINGELITNGSAVDSENISLENNAKGVYIITVTAGTATKTIKVIRK